MDPNACLKLLGEARTARAQLAHFRDLRDWLTKGGFAPDWSLSERGTHSSTDFPVHHHSNLQRQPQ